MSLVIDGKVVVGPGNSPYIGSNGNWFVGDKDTGFSASSNMHYVTTEDFKTCYKNGIYYVYDPTMNKVETWHINEYGKKSLLISQNILVPVVGSNGNWFIGDTDMGIPATSGSGTVAGASINDDTINQTTVWSSSKTQTEIEKIKEEGITGKDLEFRWEGSNLGVRQQGYQEYRYQNLQGPAGLTGLDGSAIVDVRIDDNGDMYFTVQESEDEEATHRILALETHVLTYQDIKNINNSINRLNREVYNIRSSLFRKTITIPHDTNGEYEEVVKFSGAGNCQLLVSKFTGSIKVTVDGTTYTKDVDKSTLSDTSLLSINTENVLDIVDIFKGIVSSSLDIQFHVALTIEVKVTGSDYPRFLLQGNHYYSSSNNNDSPGDGGGSGSGEGDYIPSESMSDTDVDAMMGLL